MSAFLFLDDVRSPEWVHWMRLPVCDNWAVVRTHEEFVAWIQTHGVPRFISFDHDLAGVDDDGAERDPTAEKTGYDSAKWLVEWCLDHECACPDFAVHSQNPAGAENIRGLLTAFAKFQQAQTQPTPTPPKPMG